MIVKKMTPEEIFKEVEKDVQHFIQSGFVRELSKKYSRFSKKTDSNKFPYKCSHIDFKTDTKNKLHMINYILDKHKNFFNSLIYHTRVLESGGIEVYRLNGVIHNGENTDKGVQIYVPHLFQRYKERNELDVSGYALIKKFFDDNPITFNFEYSFYDGELEMSSLCMGGMLLGCYADKSKTNVIYKTYLSEKEMNEEQLIYYNNIQRTLTSEMDKLILMTSKKLNYNMNNNYVKKLSSVFEFIASTNIIRY